MAPRACTEHPFSGNPEAVDSATTELQQIAAQLVQQALTLSGKVNALDRWEGIARDAFQSKVGDLPQKIEQSGQRYSQGANALGPYATLIRQARLGQQQLCTTTGAAEVRVANFRQDLANQKQWERNERERAARALTDPSQGSPVAARWHGPNNVLLLQQAQTELSNLDGDFDRLKNSFDSSADGIAAQVLAAAQVYADKGGISGFIEHRQADVKKAVKYLREHGFDLNMISELLGTISSILAFAALIPGLQILGVVATVIAVVKLAIDLVLVVAGEKSVASFLIGAALTLAPFALKGAGAVVLKNGAKGLKTVSGGVARGNTLVSNARLLGRAQQYQKSLAFTQRLDKISKVAHLAGRGHKGHVLIMGGRQLHGAAAKSTANAIVNLSHGNKVLNTAEKAFEYTERAHKYYERGKKVVDFSHRFSKDNESAHAH